MSDKSDPKPEKPQRASLFRTGPKPASSPPPKKAPPPILPKRRRRSGLGAFSALLSFVLIGVLIGLGAFVAALLEINRPGPLEADKVVILTREDDGGPIGEQLERAHVIDNALLFSGITLLDGTRSGLKRGEYEFKAQMTLRDVEQLLLSHKVVQHKFSVPEGLTSDQVVQRLRSEDAFAGDIKEPPREGSLLPDTYFFERGDSRSAMLTRMAKAQAKAVDDIWKRRSPDLPIKSPGELVTLASVVEKETGKVDERSRVAGVFVNRLQKHMKLQSDPTIVYGLVFGKGTLGRPISRADLLQATPYNTYVIDGLPPGPICNPGKAALEAAASPAKTGDLYFVADGTGGHAFASTLDLHLKNVAHWRQIEQDAKDKVAPDAGTPGATSPATHGELTPADGVLFGAVQAAPPDPRVFGVLALAPTPPARLDPKSKTLTAKLAKIGDSRLKSQALVAAGGPLSLQGMSSSKTIDGLGAVITGVNDAPETFTFGEDPPGTGGPAASAPMSSAALAEQKAREAKYGYGTAAVASSAPTPAPAALAPNGKAAIYDASEGTALDPLKNKTYDLSFAKDVPNLK
jgi:UPF0755 protein